VALGDMMPDEILRLALGVERHSEHPLARAVLEAGAARGVEVPAATEFEALPGRGALARVGELTVHVGNERLLEELGVLDAAVRAVLARLTGEGKTAVGVVVAHPAGGDGAGSTRTVIGVLGLVDRLRHNARIALDRLRAVGIRRIVMLTGDNAGTARRVAAAVGIDEVHAELRPDDKVRLVRALEAGGECVVFVGDGVNDAPALAAAADIALMGDDLETLAFAMRISRKTMGIVKQNVAVSLAVKAVFLVLAVSGWATLWMAVAADMGGSLLVVANGLRARRA
jgi:Cd2+/Zn2+-exporting ATPase